MACTLDKEQALIPSRLIPLGVQLTKWSRERAVNFRAATRSRKRFLEFLETKETAYGRTEERTIWKNEDLDLTPPKDWTWAWYDFAAFWWSYGFSIGVWSLGSSMIALGLTWWQAIICVFISHTLGAIGIAFHSRLGAKYHFGFPVECRITWGLRGSYFPVFVRLLVGTIWNGVNTLEGGYFMAILLRCIFGKRYYNMYNSFSPGADITVQELVGFIIFMVITAPILAIPIPKLRRVYTIKSVVLPPVVIGLFVFCILVGKDAGGSGGEFNTTVPLSGSTLAWAMLSAINSCMGKTSASVANQTDLSRYARTPRAPFWSQLIAIPIGNTLCATLGIFATSATHRAWGVLIWNPWDLCDYILTLHWTAGARTGIALVCMGFMLSTFASNLGVNVIPWGADAMVVCPRFINIKRGMYICYALGMVICPWKILKSATTFLRFLGGYSIFLAPIVGIFITDYYVIRRGNIWTSDLYTPTKGTSYWYHHGISWRAFTAFVIGIVLPIPGFAAEFGHEVPVVWEHIYSLGWILGCIISSVAYYGLCQIGGGNFAKGERELGFEEAYDLQELFQQDSSAEVTVGLPPTDDSSPIEKSDTRGLNAKQVGVKEIDGDVV
ncbi:MAG: hypothetical protein M1834_006416 [Cirrosporium novae-zelandiae]|nr:MAG: hypothetical protein M1834_006416 [Cirrosporium novae-zelandiae]